MSQYALTEYKPGPSRSSRAFEAIITLDGVPHMKVYNDGTEHVYDPLTLAAEEDGTFEKALNALDEHAAAWRAKADPQMAGFEDTDAFINHLIEARDDIDIEAVRQFIGRSMQDELNMAQQAGHGHSELYFRGEEPATWTGWCHLDLSDNVRASYDMRFAKHWSPKQVINRLYAEAKIVAAITDVEALLVFAQQYADSPWAERLGWKPEWKRETPNYLHRQVSEAIDALAGRPR